MFLFRRSLHIFRICKRLRKRTNNNGPFEKSVYRENISGNAYTINRARRGETISFQKCVRIPLEFPFRTIHLAGSDDKLQHHHLSPRSPSFTALKRYFIFSTHAEYNGFPYTSTKLYFYIYKKKKYHV